MKEWRRQVNLKYSKPVVSYLHGVLFSSSRGMVHYSVRRDVSTNDGHRHGAGKVVGKEVRRCKFIHFNAACNHSQERANSSTFFIQARYWYVLLLATLPFIERNCAFTLFALHYAVCANDYKLYTLEIYSNLPDNYQLLFSWIAMDRFVLFSFFRGTSDISFIIWSSVNDCKFSPFEIHRLINERSLNCY